MPLARDKLLLVEGRDDREVVYQFCNPGTALGQAITKRYLDPSRAPAPAFRDWLLELFARPLDRSPGSHSEGQ